ncbi:MAG: carboxypeptidase regulatory-like domain-containing protein, partial [Opitutaceae bacterium]|nr:carboxypeptidase regulatory-like domain-containing protein [Opitutaceae bacterium]
MGSAVGIASGLSGRVIDATSHEPVAGASVSIAGAADRPTDERGCFSFTGVSVQTGTVVTVRHYNYYETRTVTVPLGTRSVDMGDIALGALGSVQVTEIKPQYDGFFLQGVGLSNRYTAHINWGGRKPGTVKWYVNGV